MIGRPVAPVVSLGLWVLTVALVVVGAPIVVAPASTDRSFAWTIDVPLTAAFLGACYWTAALFTLLSAREREWARGRCVMPGILVAGTLILVATLVHVSRFAMDAMRGWLWVILYAGLPPGVLLLLALQRRVPGADPPVLRPIEGWAAVLLALAAAALLIVAAALFAFPRTSGGWWPWPLTELTARMVGAWLAAIGSTLVAVVVEGDWARVRAAMVYLAAVAAAQLGTLARYPDTVQWDDLAAWLYVAFFVALLALAGYGLRVRRRAPAEALVPFGPVPDHGQPRSYLEVDAGVDVVSADGQRVGALEHVLADEQADIFDGIVIDVSAGPGGHRFVDAPEVSEFCERAVLLGISAADVEHLPEPSANPAVMQHGGEEDAEGPLEQKLRRAWDLISGRY